MEEWSGDIRTGVLERRLDAAEVEPTEVRAFRQVVAGARGGRAPVDSSRLSLAMS
jgi:hypothetical protein